MQKAEERKRQKFCTSSILSSGRPRAFSPEL
jgi:hypothetical protein